MEITCSRCHRPVSEESCFCPSCGLPQLVYSPEGETLPAVFTQWTDRARDAGSIDWKKGLRAALALAVPAGLLSSGVSPLNFLGVFWMAGAAAWAVLLYLRSERSTSITTGSGARIGLVTGLIAAWVAFGISGAGLFVTRVAMHQGNQIDSAWKILVETSEQKVLDITLQAGARRDVAQAEVNAQRSLMLSPEGHAGFQTGGLAWNCFLLILFAIGGGALGARSMSRTRRPGV